jgi:gliding motility-associated-like protein
MVHLLRSISVVFLLGTCLCVFSQSSNPVGDAYASVDDCYVVTTNLQWQLGAVWFNDALDLTDPFEITLTMNMGDNDWGADGLVFVFQQVGNNALGLPGGGIGFQGFSPSLGIELDTWQNNDFGDPVDDHMAMLLHGSVDHNSAFNQVGPVNISADSPNVEDGQDHVFQLIWDPSANLLEVYFDCELRISHTINIVEFVFSGDPIVWWGFTGATGGESNEQSVCISQFALGLDEDYQICAGESVQLGVTSDGDGDFLWEPSDYLDDPTSPTPIATPEQTTTYTVSFTNLCGETLTEETTIEVTDLEVSLPETFNACEGDILSIQVNGNADDYTWSNGDTGTSTNSTSSEILEVTGTANGCEASDQIDIVFHPNPVVDGLNESYEACEGEIIILDATADIGDSYEWSTGEGEPLIEIGASGTYEVTVTSSEQCEATFSTEVNITSFPNTTLPEFLSECEGTALMLTAGDADEWLWNTGDTTQNIDADTEGTYSVVMSNGECQTSDSVVVSYFEPPSFAWTDQVQFCSDTTIWLVIPTLDYQWFWQNQEVSDSVQISFEGWWEMSAVDNITGCETSAFTFAEVLNPPLLSLPAKGVLCEEEPLVIRAQTDQSENALWEDGTEGDELTVFTEGVYSISTFNQCGTATASIEVYEERCSCEFFIPNSFTPDNDGINELFLPILDCDVERYEFSIFNRWGDKIFSSVDIGEGWTGAGTGNTHYVQNDIYLWQVTYQVSLFSGVELVDKTGFVLVGR